MLTKEELYVQNEMPDWNEISMRLYKEFSTDCLFTKIFRYHFVNGSYIDVVFKEWAMKHLWGLQHVTNIKKNKLFDEIDKGLTFETLADTKGKKKRLNDNKDRIRMFACICYVLKTGATFYVQGGQLDNSLVRINYIRSKIISQKGVNVGMRYEENAYVPLTLLIDRAINPTKTITGLIPMKVSKLEIIENGNIIEDVHYKYYEKFHERKSSSLQIREQMKRPSCFSANTYCEKMKRIKLRNLKRK